MSKLFIAVALCIVAATIVLAEVNPAVDLKDGEAYTAQTNTITTVYRFKTSKAYKNSTLLVDFTRYYGWGPQPGISSLSVYRCVYDPASLSVLDAYVPTCAVEDNDEAVHCRARVPSCIVEPNTQYFIRVTTDVATTFNITVTEVEAKPLALPAPSAVQTVVDKDDKLYSFDVPRNNTWIFVNLIPEASNSDVLTLYFNEGRIADPDGCPVLRTITTATNTSRANLTVSPTRNSILSSCYFTTAGTYFIRVRTESEVAQRFTLDVKLTPPETPVVPSGVQTVVGGSPNYYHFNTSNTNTVFRISVTPTVDNEHPFTVVVSPKQIPDVACPLVSDLQWSDTLPLSGSFYNDSAVNFTFTPTCGYENATYYIMVYTQDYALAKYTIKASQTAIVPNSLPALDQTVNSDHIDFYHVNFTSTDVVRTLVLQSSNNTANIRMYVSAGYIPDSACSWSYTCTDSSFSDKCSIRFTPSCHYKNVSTYYVRVETSTVVDQTYNLTIEEEAVIVEELPAGEVSVNSEVDKIYIFRPANNVSHLVAKISTPETNNASVTLRWSFRDVPDVEGNCGQVIDSVTVPSNTTRFLYAPATPPCGYNNETVYLRVVTTTESPQKFTLSVTQPEQVYTPLPTDVATVQYPVDTLYNYTTSGSSSWFSITLESDENNGPVSMLQLYVAYSPARQIPYHDCSIAFLAYKECEAASGESCTIYYSPTCSYQAGTYSIRVHSNTADGEAKLFKIHVREYNHTTLEPATGQVVNATIDKVYQLTTDANPDIAVLVQTTYDSAPSIDIGITKRHVFDPACRSTTCSNSCRRIYTPTCPTSVNNIDNGHVNGTYYARVFGAGAENNFNISMKQFTSHESISLAAGATTTATLRCNHLSICFYEITLPSVTTTHTYQVSVRNPNPAYGALSFVHDQHKWPVTGCGLAHTCTAAHVNSGSCTFAWTQCMGSKIYMSLVSDSVAAGAGSQAELEITVTRDTPTPLEVQYDTDPVYLNNDTTLEPIVLALPPIVGNPAVQTLNFHFEGYVSTNATVFLNVFSAENPYTCHATPLRNYACQHTGSGTSTSCVIAVPACDLAKSGLKNLWALVHTTNLNVQLTIYVDHSHLVEVGEAKTDTVFPYDSVQYTLPTPPARGWNTVKQAFSAPSTTLYDVQCGTNVEFGATTQTLHLRCYEPTQSTVVSSYNNGDHTNYLSSVTSRLTFTQTVPVCIKDSHTVLTTSSDTWYEFETTSNQKLTITIRNYNGFAVLYPEKDCNGIASNVTIADNTNYIYVSRLPAGRYHLSLLSTATVFTEIELDFSGSGAKSCEKGPVSDIVCNYVDKDNSDLHYCKPYVGNGYYTTYVYGGAPLFPTISYAEQSALTLYSSIYSSVDKVNKDCNSSLLKYACERYFTKCGADGEITPSCEPQCRNAFSSCSSNRCLGALCQIDEIGGRCAGTLYGITPSSAHTVAVSAAALIVALVVALVF